MREIKISQETATRWYNGTDSELKALALQTYPELAVKELPKTWEELVSIKGYYVNGATSKAVQHESATSVYDKNIFATKEQAEASIALAQLSQLLKVYNDGWEPDWNDNVGKYTIFFREEKIKIADAYATRSFLNFKDRKTAELFLENFSELIHTAKPLL